MQRLILPQAVAQFTVSGISSEPLFSGNRDLLLLCGGRPPGRNWLREAASGRELCCADSGADLCREEKLLPGSFVGDGDSVDPETLEWLRNSGVPCTMLPREKDQTDYQVALEDIASWAFVRSLVVTGIWGGRFDHLYSALFSSLDFLNRAEAPRLAFGDSREMLLFLRSGEALDITFSPLPEVFSLLPLSEECRGVTSRGTKWDLHEVVLRQHYPYAISNEMSPSEKGCSVKLERGILGVYAWWS